MQTIANTDDYSKYMALNKLAGKNNSLLYDASMAGTAKGYEAPDKALIQQELDNAKYTFNTGDLDALTTGAGNWGHQIDQGGKFYDGSPGSGPTDSAGWMAGAQRHTGDSFAQEMDNYNRFFGADPNSNTAYTDSVNRMIQSMPGANLSQADTDYNNLMDKFINKSHATIKKV